MRFPISYWNGNTRVTLWADGTKWREWPDDEDPLPLYPESIDLKITDYCDAGCPWCHESSTTRGRHADLSPFFRISRRAPKGMEVAIGGGNPLSHPDISWFLGALSHYGFVANLTVNSFHLADDETRKALDGLIRGGLIKGLGVSYQQRFSAAALGTVSKYESAVLHLIAGIDDPNVAGCADKVLVLGYKTYGRGNQFSLPNDKMSSIAKNLSKWEDWFKAGEHPRVLCFDNLALSQLNIKAAVSNEEWESGYMGDDGKFTLYVDLVTDTFAVSSTSPRKPIDGMSLKGMLAVTSGRAR